MESTAQQAVPRTPIPLPQHPANPPSVPPPHGSSPPPAMQLTCGASTGAGRRRPPRRYPPPPPAPAFNPAPCRLCLHDLAPPRLRPRFPRPLPRASPEAPAPRRLHGFLRPPVLPLYHGPSRRHPVAALPPVDQRWCRGDPAGTCSASATGASSSSTSCVVNSSCGIPPPATLVALRPHRSSMARRSSSATARCFVLPATKVQRGGVSSAAIRYMKL